MAKFKKAADGAHRRLADSSKPIELLDGEAPVWESKPSKMIKARDAPLLISDGRLRKVRALDALVCMLRDILDLRQRCESTNCSLEVITRKVADAQGDITNPATRLHENTTSFYDDICRNVDGAIVEVS